MTWALIKETAGGGNEPNDAWSRMRPGPREVDGGRAWTTSCWAQGRGQEGLGPVGKTTAAKAGA
eukprot:9069530-Alexandrium_andersonii.AAC.1